MLHFIECMFRASTKLQHKAVRARPEGWAHCGFPGDFPNGEFRPQRGRARSVRAGADGRASSAERHLRAGAALGSQNHRGLRPGRAHRVSAAGPGPGRDGAAGSGPAGTQHSGSCPCVLLALALQNPTPACPASVSSIHQLRSKVSEEHEVIKKKELETGPKASYGYGGKFGTERDRMDKVTAVGGFPEPQWKSAFLIKEGASLFSGLTLKGEYGEFAWIHTYPASPYSVSRICLNSFV